MKPRSVGARVKTLRSKFRQEKLSREAKSRAVAATARAIRQIDDLPFKPTGLKRVKKITLRGRFIDERAIAERLAKPAEKRSTDSADVYTVEVVDIVPASIESMTLWCSGGVRVTLSADALHEKGIYVGSTIDITVQR